MPSNSTDFAALSRGFRTHYLDFSELTDQLKTWAKAFPDCVGLKTIGQSREGRELWLLTVGRNAGQKGDGRPAVWVDGNLHASEICGSSASLAIAEDAIRLMHGETPHSIPAHVADTLRNVVFYVMPRISPDGAEAVLKTGRYVRSSPLDRRSEELRAYWRSEDVDGDGVVRLMRKKDPAGELVESRDIPGLMMPRRLESEGPFYKIFPEGHVANFDGSKIPSPYFLGDNSDDYNRNFPFQWKPEPTQAGAGDYPGSAPETQAIMQFASAHPNIFAWLNFHTFGGVFIRPMGDKPDHKMDQGDLAVFKQIERWNTEITSYPTVSGFHDFLYEPEKPLYGDLSDYAYNQRGAIGYVCELWDIFRRIGMEPVKPFVDHYQKMEEKHYLALAAWDKEHNKGRIFQPWRPFQHPQLGDVEIGGVDIRVGVSNPPLELIDEVVTAQSHAFLRVAALVPKVSLTWEAKGKAADGASIEVHAVNTGYLATFGLPSAKNLPVSEPLHLKIECEDGVMLTAPQRGKNLVLEIGHLEGWGQGLHSGASLFLPWTRGGVSEKKLNLTFEGKGRVRLTLASVRVGKIERSLNV